MSKEKKHYRGQKIVAPLIEGAELVVKILDKGSALAASVAVMALCEAKLSEKDAMFLIMDNHIYIYRKK